MLAEFRSGKYKFEWEDVDFDMAQHNKLLSDTAAEVKDIRAKQAVAQTDMIKAENESLAKWREEKAKNKVDDNTIESLLAGMLLVSQRVSVVLTDNYRSKIHHNRRAIRRERVEGHGGRKD